VPVKASYIVFFLTVSSLFQVSAHIPDSLRNQFRLLKGDSARFHYILNLSSQQEDLVKQITLAKYALEFAQEKSLEEEKIHALFYLGARHSKLANFQTALSLLYEARKLADQKSYGHWKPRIVMMIGIVYDKIGDRKNALSHYFEALNLYKQDDNLRYQAIIYNNIGLVYYFHGEYLKSLDYLNRSLKIKKQIGSAEFRHNYGNFGRVYHKLGKYDSAKIFFNKGLALTPYRSDSAELHGFIGQLYFDLNNYELAVDHLSKSIKLAASLGLKDVVVESSGPLTLVFEKTREFEKALEIAQLHQLYVDSLYNETSQKRLAMIEARYKQAQLEQTLSQQQTITYIIAGFFIIIISVIFYSSYIRSKRKASEELLTQKTAELKGQEKERKRIAEDLHDGLGGTLAGLKLSLLNLEIPNINGKVDKMIDNIDMASNEARNIAHNLTPPDFEKFTFTNTLSNYFKRINQQNSMVFTVELFPEEQFNKLPIATLTTLYRIIQELSTNIVKHASASFAEIQLTKHDNYVNLLVEDNGNGFDLSNKTEGIGLSNIRSRVKVANGQIDIDTAPGRGTVVNINLTTGEKPHRLWNRKKSN